MHVLGHATRRDGRAVLWGLPRKNLPPAFEQQLVDASEL